MFKQIKRFIGKAYRAAKIFVNPGRSAGQLIKDTFVNFGSQYAPQVKRMLEQYGNQKIVNIKLCRQIVSKNNEILLQVLAGKKTWEDAKRKNGFDKFYHLFLIATLENGQMLHVEKNDVIRISAAPGPCPESYNVGNTDLTLNELLEKTRMRIGNNNFFVYDPFSNNCQQFIKQLLTTANLYDAGAKDFVYQDIVGLRDDIPGYSRWLAKALTSTAAFFNTAYQKAKDYIEYGDERPKDQGLDNTTNAA